MLLEANAPRPTLSQEQTCHPFQELGATLPAHRNGPRDLLTRAQTWPAHRAPLSQHSGGLGSCLGWGEGA